MSRRYRVNRFRVLKKYIDMYAENVGVNPKETRREAVLDFFSFWHDKKHLNRYVDKYIKNPDIPSKYGCAVKGEFR
ncbi:MAG: hypothetical protein J6W16_06730 [Methanobrevibacter sp.]|nr:hypothetical protein [Methanobrevibacter sp.]MBP5785258.1 hypothetical protein [Methanobrevibacter sp.]